MHGRWRGELRLKDGRALLSGPTAACLCLAGVIGGNHSARADEYLPQNIDWRVDHGLPTQVLPALVDSHTAGEIIIPLHSGRTLRVQPPVLPPESAPTREVMPWSEDSGSFSYQRDFNTAFTRTRSGLDIALTPHTGVTYNDSETTALAGATLRVGQNLRDLARSGDDVFGDRPRWYVYAAGSRRTVGYNFQQGRDGDLMRAGMTQERGGTFGDASIGLAYRRGPIESSLGIVYRENETKGLRRYEGLRTKVDEGILAFQVSIRPR